MLHFLHIRRLMFICPQSHDKAVYNPFSRSIEHITEKHQTISDELNRFPLAADTIDAQPSSEQAMQHVLWFPR